MPNILHGACPDCGSDMVLRSSSYGPFYGCTTYPKCDATHGAHKDGRPLGTAAALATRGWRSKAHDAFDMLWRKDGMSRPAAYLWLAGALGVEPDCAHIGMCDVAMCKNLIAAVNARRMTP